MCGSAYVVKTNKIKYIYAILFWNAMVVDESEVDKYGQIPMFLCEPVLLWVYTYVAGSISIATETVPG